MDYYSPVLGIPPLLEILQRSYKMTQLQKEELVLNSKNTIYTINGRVTEITKEKLSLIVNYYYQEPPDDSRYIGYLFDFFYQESFKEKLLLLNPGDYITCAGNLIKINRITEMLLIDIHTIDLQATQKEDQHEMTWGNLLFITGVALLAAVISFITKSQGLQLLSNLLFYISAPAAVILFFYLLFRKKRAR